ncbi:MAG: hypothetical protein IKR04_00855 [Clostridia bacterium]|nr:hypothetical protein [Clostridia bacterium]
MKKNLSNNNRGSEIITTPVVIAIGLMLVAVLIVFCVNILMPYIWYEKLSSTCLKYVFVMEEYGYLTNKEKQNLINDLKNQGFDTAQLIVDSTTRRQVYGSPIKLNVRYVYKMKLPIVGNKNVVMNISRESVSKR